MSTSILISSRMTPFSFSISSSRNSGLQHQVGEHVEGHAADARRGLWCCKLTSSFEVNASRSPPMESTERAISSAERLVVPLKTMCSMKWEMPFCSGGLAAGTRTDPDAH